MPFFPKKTLKMPGWQHWRDTFNSHLAKRLDVYRYVRTTYVEKRGRKLRLSSTWRSREKLLDSLDFFLRSAKRKDSTMHIQRTLSSAHRRCHTLLPNRQCHIFFFRIWKQVSSFHVRWKEGGGGTVSHHRILAKTKKRFGKTKA